MPSGLKRKKTIQIVTSTVWRCVSAYGMGNLHINEDTINANRHIQVLEQHMIKKNYLRTENTVVLHSKHKEEVRFIHLHKLHTCRGFMPGLLVHESLNLELKSTSSTGTVMSVLYVRCPAVSTSDNRPIVAKEVMVPVC